MRARYLLLLLVIFLLSGCSLVEVDPAEDTETVDNTTTETSKPKEEGNKLTNAISDFLSFEWFTSKNEEAKPIFYLALGDSLTRGVGDENNNFGYTGVLKGELEKWPAISEVELDNRGKNGRRSDQLLNLVAAGHYDEQLEKADLVTITLGGNDVMKVVRSDLFNLNEKMFKKALPPFVERYTTIIEYLREKTDAPIVLVGFYNPFSIITDVDTPFETIIGDWNAEIEKLAANTPNACFVPVEDLFNTNVDMVYHTDFFHPNATGYEKMANRVKEKMMECNIEDMTDGLIGFEE